MFLVFFALEGEHKSVISMSLFSLIVVDSLVFFASGLVPPIMLELSSASRIIEGIGCTPFTFDASWGLIFPSRCSRLWGFQPRIWGWNDRSVDLLHDLNLKLTSSLHQLDPL